MRHRIKQPRAKKYKEYRVRFYVSAELAPIVGGDGDRNCTARPGIIKNNRPKAERVLRAISITHQAWLEVRESASDEWKKI